MTTNETRETMKVLFRIFLILIAMVLLLNAAYLWTVSNFNLGLLLLTILGGFLLLYALFSRLFHFLLNNRLGRWIKFFILLATAYFIFVSSAITMSAATDTASFKEDAVIVLGAGIHGEEVSRVLAYRLDAAVTYHKINPTAYIVVSGGQGAQESITEAEAMKRYLVKRGVDPAVILKEENATSTYENFLFSKQILDETFPDGYKVAFISNRFHLFRASRLAKSAGLSAQRMHADSDLVTLLPDYLRECCAIGYMWLTGK